MEFSPPHNRDIVNPDRPVDLAVELSRPPAESLDLEEAGWTRNREGRLDHRPVCGSHAERCLHLERRGSIHSKDAEANSLIGGDSLGTDLSPKAMSSWLHDYPLREVAVVHVFRPAESDSQRPATRLEDFGIARRLKLPRDCETTR